MADQIRLTWYVKHQHTETFTPEEWAEWLNSNRLGVDDPTDLDAVYEVLDERGYPAGEALIELASPRNWLDSDFNDAEPIDLQLESGEEA